jgi:hypothetical protein
MCTTPDDAEPKIVEASAPRPRQAMPVHAHTTERARIAASAGARRVSAGQLDPTPLRLVELTEVVATTSSPRNARPALGGEVDQA